MADLTDLSAGPTPPAFWLVPVNGNARRATADPNNQYLSSALQSGSWGLYLSFTDEAKQEITLGRGSTDIYLPEPRGSNADISKHQCSFVNYTERGAVLLVDHSSKSNTEPYSSNQGGLTIPFVKDKRSVLVARGINTYVAFGRDRYYQFQIEWQSDGLYDFPNKDEPYTVGPTSRRKKYLKGDYVGGGAYGTVWRALDVNSGELMAVKSFHRLDGKNLEFAKREVDNLVKINKSSKILHSHIIEILGSSGGKSGDNFLEIMMPLKEGNLKTLVEAQPTVDFSHLVLRQMLLALKCLAEHQVIHRDVKPENILYEFNNNNTYHFRLGDFGLSHDQTQARTLAGTEPFMAPEVLNRRRQTEKVDIWSLFATIVWVRDIDNFRRNCSQRSVSQIHDWLVHLSGRNSLSDVRSMASLKASQRPTAKELLKTLSRQPIPSFDPTEDLAEAFQEGLTMQEDDEEDDVAGPSRQADGYDDEDEDAEDQDTFPQPYYEPYSPELHDWGQHDNPGGYDLPAQGFPPRGGRNNWGNYNNNPFNSPAPAMDPREAWIRPLEDPYGPAEGSTAGTEVPDIQTARPLPTQDLHQQSNANPDRKGKGKQKRK